MKHRIISIPPVYFFACIIATILLYFFVPSMNKIAFPITILMGTFFLLLGGYIVAHTHFKLKKYDTPETYQRSTSVVTSGAYAYSRNPMYVGFVVLLFGLSCLFGNILSFLCPLFFFAVMNWMFIPYEEEKMERELGDEYREYKENVERWI